MRIGRFLVVPLDSLRVLGLKSALPGGYRNGSTKPGITPVLPGTLTFWRKCGIFPRSVESVFLPALPTGRQAAGRSAQKTGALKRFGARPGVPPPHPWFLAPNHFSASGGPCIFAGLLGPAILVFPK